MRRLVTKSFLSIAFIIQFMALQAWAAGGEGLDVPEALERDVSLEGLTGIRLFIAHLYNDNLLLFAILCTILMAVVGTLIAYVTDIGLKIIGFETEKISHKE